MQKSNYLKRIVSKLKGGDDDDIQGDVKNTLEYKGIVIRRFTDGWGIQTLSKLDAGFPLHIVKTYVEIESCVDYLLVSRVIL